MDCTGARHLLERYIDGQLEPALGSQVGAHLRGCAGCAAQHRAAVTLPLRLAALQAPFSADLVPQVMARVSARRVAARVSAALLTLEAVLACLALVQFGLGGLLAAAAASLRDGSALFGGSAAGPAPGDLGLVLTLLLLVAVTSVHLGLLAVSTSRRRSA